MFNISYEGGATSNITSFESFHSINNLLYSCSFNVNFESLGYDFPLGSSVSVANDGLGIFKGRVVSLGHAEPVEEDTFLVTIEAEASILSHTETTASLFFESGGTLESILRRFLDANSIDSSILDLTSPLLSTASTCRFGSFVGSNAEEEVLKFCNGLGVHVIINEKGLIELSSYNTTVAPQHNIPTNSAFFNSYETEFSSSLLNGKTVGYIESNVDRTYSLFSPKIDTLDKSPTKVMHSPFRYNAVQATNVLNFYNAYNSRGATRASITLDDNSFEDVLINIGDTVTITDATDNVNKNYTVLGVQHNQEEGDTSSTYILGTFGCLSPKLSPLKDTDCVFTGFSEGFQI